MNVSPVPLQSRAFERQQVEPRVSRSDWELLEHVRSHRALVVAELPPDAGDVNRMLLPGLQSRLTKLNLSSNATIFLAGNFVHRTWRSLAMPPNRTVKLIPHASNRWWDRTTRDEYRANLSELALCFTRLTS